MGAGPDKFGMMMEPIKTQNNMPPPYMQKFIAGPTRLEQNPLSEPSRNFNNNSPQKSHQLADYDLKNPDTQFERYKQLMTNQYYNNHANSSSANFY